MKPGNHLLKYAKGQLTVLGFRITVFHGKVSGFISYSGLVPRKPPIKKSSIDYMCSVVTTNYIGKTFAIYLLIIRYSYIQESVHVQNVVNYIKKTLFMILLYWRYIM